MLSFLFRLLFKLSGWKARVTLPNHNKIIFLVAPHTSNFDYLIGFLYTRSVNLQVNMLMKKELFRFPLKNILLKTGAIPVDRKNKTNIRQQLINRFNKNTIHHLVITPEGTRRYNPNWKKGFHEIALQTKAIILPVKIDYQYKCIESGEAFMASKNIQSDMAKLNQFYRGTVPKYISNFALNENGMK